MTPTTIKTGTHQNKYGLTNKIHCNKGHEYDIIMTHGGRGCSTCRKEYNRQYYLNSKQKSNSL